MLKKNSGFAECGFCGLVFLAVIIYFPAKPPTPPTVTASKANMPFVKAIRELFRYMYSNVIKHKNILIINFNSSQI